MRVLIENMIEELLSSLDEIDGDADLGGQHDSEQDPAHEALVSQ